MTVPGVEAKNVEVKAQILSQEEYDRKLTIARSLTGTMGETLKQHDVFFNSQNGMLKLRYIEVQIGLESFLCKIYWSGFEHGN